LPDLPMDEYYEDYKATFEKSFWYEYLYKWRSRKSTCEYV
jgi:hypothetical protein